MRFDPRPPHAGRYPLLSSLNLPDDLHTLSSSKLLSVANELRAFLIETISEVGGHFAAGLGTVELSVALHHLYHSPTDKLVWDVGHQAYPHKVLTGRADRLHSIRQLGGLAPFPDRNESPHDSFGVGHSSTSISAALGMQIAMDKAGHNNHAVAIIGDGGMTAGMAFEALNHAGECRANLLVIYNDNDMSISPNVGALSSNLTKMISGQTLSSMREEGKRVLGLMPEPIWEFAKRAEEHVKGMIMPGTLFEEFGFNYYGPIDGHDLPTLIETIGNLKQLKGPRLLHITTKKGKGYAPAEAEPVKYHGVGKFDPKQGITSKASNQAPSYSQIFGDWLLHTAPQDPQLFAITPAMAEGSGMVKFAQTYPQLFCDVGIAEQHSVTVAAGLAAQGLKPIVAIYSTFLQRAYDQLIHDIALQKLPVTFAIDRAGLVGPDGPTHAGSYDLSYLRCIPNMIIMCPSNEDETWAMLNTAQASNLPCAIRYPRGASTGIGIQDKSRHVQIGKANCRRVAESISNKVALLAFGSMVGAAERIGGQLDTSVYDMRFVKPLDIETLKHVATTHDMIITIEENVVAGGAGSHINETIANPDHHIHWQGPILNFGLPDQNLPHGSRDELLAQAGLDEDSLRNRIQAAISNHLGHK